MLLTQKCTEFDNQSLDYSEFAVNEIIFEESEGIASQSPFYYDFIIKMLEQKDNMHYVILGGPVLFPKLIKIFLDMSSEDELETTNKLFILREIIKQEKDDKLIDKLKISQEIARAFLKIESKTDNLYKIIQLFEIQMLLISTNKIKAEKLVFEECLLDKLFFFVFISLDVSEEKVLVLLEFMCVMFREFESVFYTWMQKEHNARNLSERICQYLMCSTNDDCLFCCLKLLNDLLGLEKSICVDEKIKSESVQLILKLFEKQHRFFKQLKNYKNEKIAEISKEIRQKLE